METPQYQMVHAFLTPIDIANFLKFITFVEGWDENPWEEGRQGTGYDKINVTETTEEFIVSMCDKALARLGGIDRPTKWDAYLIRMKDGAYIQPHKDAVEDGNHHRLNACILPGGRGGRFSIEGEHAPVDPGCAIIFRPDRMRHEVSMVNGSPRYMFSVGCLI